MSNNLDELFPLNIPPPPSHLSPTRWPGIDTDSTKSLIKTLKDDYERWHVFFNEKGFHNHTTHHLLATWALGGNGPLIEKVYEEDVKMQRKAFESPEPISMNNFVEHLGDENFYNAYLNFFGEQIKKEGISATLNTFLFGQKFNWDSAIKEDEKQPHMLNRFMEGLVHPLIHTGHGAEFGLIGMVAEGMAWTAVHGHRTAAIHPREMFTARGGHAKSASTSPVALVTSLLPSLSLRSKSAGDSTSTSSTTRSNHALALLGRILNDPDMTPLPEVPGMAQSVSDVVKDEKRTKAIIRYSEEWAEGIDGPGMVDAKTEELAWMNAFIYAIGGFREGKEFTADFFLMHLVTSSIFIPSLVAVMEPSNQGMLLRAYYATCITWYLQRGRPSFPISAFYAATSPVIKPPSHTEPVPDDAAEKEFASEPARRAPNSWLPALQSAMAHPDDHLPKIQRALAHWAGLYGSKPPGTFADLATGKDGEKVKGLEGIEKLDGTLFVRAAGLTIEQLGWVREGQPAGNWGRIYLGE